MNIFMAFARGRFRQVTGAMDTGTMAFACRMIDSDGNVAGEFYEDAGPDGAETPGENVTRWVENVMNNVSQIPIEEPIRFILCKDGNGDAEYVINMIYHIGDFLLSGGHKKDEEPVHHWEQWKRIAGLCMSRCPEPTWEYAQSDPQSYYVANSVKKLVL